MADTITLDYQFVQKVLTAYWDLNVLKMKDSNPAEFKPHIDCGYKELRRLGAQKKTLKDLEQYAKKIGSDTVPLDEKKFGKMIWKIMSQITRAQIRKAQREGKKIEFK